MTALAIPTSAAELEEFLADDTKLKAVFEAGRFGDFTRAYANAATRKDPEIAAQIREQIELGFANYLKDNPAGANTGAPPVDLSPGPNARPVVQGVTTSAQRALYNRRAIGAAADNVFADAAEFFQATSDGAFARKVQARNPELLSKRDKLSEIMNSFGSEVPADGGFLIPEILRSEIMQIAIEEGVVRSRCTVIPMSSLRVPIPIVDDTSHASSILGGVVAYWTEEAQALTESQASFGRAVLDAKKLTAYAEVPNELLADAPAFMGFFNTVFPRAIAWFEDIAFISGTGVGEPLGFLGCPASVSVTAESGQPATTLVWENIVKMYSRMLPTSIGRAAWICNLDVFPQLATMALSVGVGGSAIWIGNVQQPGSAAPPVSILGRPVIFTEKVPTLGTTGDISFVDLSYYLLGDRQQMQSSSSEHYKFANDKVAFRVIERVDGRPWLNSALTPHSNSSNTLSPFVQLATR